jgi:decaprenyl-phosphate phosphoribosyltransferase
MTYSPPSETPPPSEPLASDVPPSEPTSQAPFRPGSVLSIVSGLVWTARPHQWIKNAVVLAPIVFAKEIFEPMLLVRAVSGFGVFCLLAGAVYTMNDLADAEADRLHPRKRHRPIAAGIVPPRVAMGFAVALVVTGLTAAALLSIPFLVTVAAYFAMNVAYSFKLKQVPYLDVGIIAAGFVLRVIAGGFGTGIYVSRYLLVCTAMGALFMGFGKRRHELSGLAAGRKSGKQRKVLESYNVKGLEWSLVLTALATVGVYLAYTLDEHTRAIFGSDALWLSVIPVILGILRFTHLVRSRPHAESPTQEMLKDSPFVAIVLSWVAMVMWIVYKLQPS